MNKKRVLVVDDEFRIRKLVVDFLKRNDYETMEAENGEEAIDILFEENQKFDLIVLDVMMPKYDGWYVLESIRDYMTTPVVMLTARSDEYDQLKGFRMGADDYVTKPFSPSVLMARINKILSKEESDESNLDFGHIHMDMQSRRVFIDQNSIDLTPKEFELLRYLIKNKGIALSRDRILNAVWNYDYYGDLRTVDTHIKQLRAKLGDYAYYISTVRSVGYRLDIENELITKE
jgi:DNA-binding response OmpR family regulator